MSDFRPAFVTPAHGRLAISELVFDQRLASIRELREVGIDARCYVVADDENLELARERGFDVVERDNSWLGARFNDGCEAAVLDGATHVVPIGSDSWLDGRLLTLVDPDFPWVTTSSRYAVLDEAGERLALLTFDDPWGVGPHVVPTSILRPPYRPWEEDVTRGCDTSLLLSLERARATAEGDPAFDDLAEARRADMSFARIELWTRRVWYLGFRSAEAQLSPFETLLALASSRDDVLEGGDAWKQIELAFPDHVAGARRLFAAVA